VAGLVDQRHQLVHVGGPVVQDVRGALLLGEVNNAGGTVDLDADGVTVGQLGQVLLAAAGGQVQQLAHARQMQAGVVHGNDANILRTENIN